MKKTIILLLGVFAITTYSVRGDETTTEAPLTPLQKFRQEVLARHNELRALHGNPPLVLSDQLNDYSQDWATRLADLNRLQHSKLEIGEYPNNERLGENILKAEVYQNFTGAEATNDWYNEIKHYDFKKGGPKSYYDITNHFTQVVWKGSKELGVGFARVPWARHFIFVVTNYKPPGNMFGDATYTREMVPPPL